MGALVLHGKTLLVQLIAEHIKNCVSRRKNMKLCMESDLNIRSQKPLRLIPCSLFLGILQTGSGLNRKNSFLFKIINIMYCCLKIEQKIITELGLKMDWQRVIAV